MAIRDAFVTGTSTFDVEETRLANAAPWAPGGTTPRVQTGIKPGPGNPGNVTATGTPDGFVHVAAFQAIIQGTRGGQGGAYTFTNDATYDLNVLSTPADSTNPRNDLVIAYVPDTFYADANSTPVIRTVVGTPSGSPSDPTTASFPDPIVLARVRVNANATTITTGNITDLRPAHVVAVGGIQPTATATTRNAIAGLYDGLYAYRRDRNWLESYDGGAWRVESLPVVSSVADLSAITNPYAGLVASCTGDGLQYRYTGSTWVPHGLWRATQSLDSPASSVTFTGIPTTLKHLELRYNARSAAAAFTDTMFMRINGVTGSNYLASQLQVQNVTGGYFVNALGTDKFYIGNIAGASSTAGVNATGVIEVNGWNAPFGNSSTLGITWRSYVYADTAANANYHTGGGQFNGNAPWTSITFYCSSNLAAGSRFDLYGYE